MDYRARARARAGAGAGAGADILTSWSRAKMEGSTTLFKPVCRGLYFTFYPPLGGGGIWPKGLRGKKMKLYKHNLSKN